ncbi:MULTISPECIES: mechanosensitive ion channel domain-containing protein [unclassified Mucilaginibacter]|uniref:mechanosensitive ion channel family protein n=1 Tax=unclassified Mucilaginibacter TaxID=2617802 RepID=UPI002AC972CC|nr:MULTISPECIES: mechanosensitive ion channel domain-containing protein [unclassified Mucilaginibacter]MEB0262828.1 mechanosensitive ion channel [Mucilaginibacter sp. 10I4]MEB0277667.1 mechanosensitive ion channel [Mucilaginibacter sp. 10B2]MEB0301926.1 mechanosensitive ion channel [Mucilaginibacter sp. 5C4]WPX24705.1 mechanosensitive ion channel [Mucilaginibacter sp. 5C4]
MEAQLVQISRQLPFWLWNSIVIAFVLLVGLVFKSIITFTLRRYGNKNDPRYSFPRSILNHLSRPLNHFIPLLTLQVLLPFIALKNTYTVFAGKWLNIILIISFSHLLMRAFSVFEDYIYHLYDLNKSDNLKERKIRTQMQFIRRIIVVAVVLVASSIILLTFDNVRKLGAGLLTGVGISGIIIGFAAQKSLGNLLAGFQIAFTQPIRIDDVLVVEGEWGRVEEITLTYVVLNIWDQRRLILPINYFIEKPFQNWTRSTSQILGTVFLYMDYAVPIDLLRDALSKYLENNILWDKRVGILQVTDSKEHTVELRALISARNSSDAYDLRCMVREHLIKFVQNNYPNSLPTIRYSKTVAISGDEN